MAKFEHQNFLKKIAPKGQVDQLMVIIATVVSVAVFVLLGLLSFIGVLQLWLTGPDFIIFAALSGSGIYGFYMLIKARRIHRIDTIFPDFVRDLAESRRAGMTFTKAILFSAKGNYGILTEEINKISQQVSWGTSVNEALLAFSDRVPTRLIKRTISLIIEASKSGGNVADVLDAASRDAREIKMLEKERRANMGSYVVVIYVGMMVFLVIIAVLSSQFLPAMIMENGSGMGATQEHVDAITMVFFWAGILQGFGSGVVAGVFEDGKFESGIKHVFIMVLISWFVFKFLIGV